MRKASGINSDCWRKVETVMSENYGQDKALKAYKKNLMLSPRAYGEYLAADRKCKKKKKKRVR